MENDPSEEVTLFGESLNGLIKDAERSRFATTGKALENSTLVSVTIDEVLEQGIMVSLAHASGTYQGILLKINNGGIPAGIRFPVTPNENSRQINENDAQPFSTLSQRHSYTSPGKGQAPASRPILRRIIKTPARFKTSRRTSRHRARQLLCAKCRIVCEEKAPPPPPPMDEPIQRPETKRYFGVTTRRGYSKMLLEEYEEAQALKGKEKPDFTFVSMGPKGLVDNLWKRPDPGEFIPDPDSSAGTLDSKGKTTKKSEMAKTGIRAKGSSRRIKQSPKPVIPLSVKPSKRVNRSLNDCVKNLQQRANAATKPMVQKIRQISGEKPTQNSQRIQNIFSNEPTDSNNAVNESEDRLPPLPKLTPVPSVRKITKTKSVAQKMNDVNLPPPPKFMRAGSATSQHYLFPRKSISNKNKAINLRQLYDFEEQVKVPVVHNEYDSYESALKNLTMSGQLIVEEVRETAVRPTLNLTYWEQQRGLAKQVQRKPNLAFNVSAKLSQAPSVSLSGTNATKEVQSSTGAISFPDAHHIDSLHSNSGTNCDLPKSVLLRRGNDGFEQKLEQLPKTPVIKICFGGDGSRNGVVMEIPSKVSCGDLGHDPNGSREVRRALRRAAKNREISITKEEISPTNTEVATSSIHHSRSRNRKFESCSSTLNPLLQQELLMSTLGEPWVETDDSGLDLPLPCGRLTPPLSDQPVKHNQDSLRNKIRRAKGRKRGAQSTSKAKIIKKPHRSMSSCLVSSVSAEKNNVNEVYSKHAVQDGCGSGESQFEDEFGSEEEFNNPKQGSMTMTTENQHQHRLCLSLKRLDSNDYVTSWNKEKWKYEKESRNPEPIIVDLEDEINEEKPGCHELQYSNSSSECSNQSDTNDFPVSSLSASSEDLPIDYLEFYTSDELEHTYKKGDLVWGKMVGCPWWPGKLIDIYSTKSKIVMGEVKWFRASTQSKIQFSLIIPFSLGFSGKYNRSRRRGSYQMAVREAMTEAHQLYPNDFPNVYI